MTTVTHGADVNQLRELGTKLHGQIESIDTILGVGTSVEGTQWVGPAREAFLSQWTNSFKPALDNLQIAFETAATECSTRATGLEQAMGGGGGSGSGAVAGAV